MEHPHNFQPRSSNDSQRCVARELAKSVFFAPALRRASVSCGRTWRARHGRASMRSSVTSAIASAASSQKSVTAVTTAWCSARSWPPGGCGLASRTADRGDGADHRAPPTRGAPPTNDRTARPRAASRRPTAKYRSSRLEPRYRKANAKTDECPHHPRRRTCWPRPWRYRMPPRG